MTDAPAATPAIASYGERNANAPSELDAFAFLIGKWEGGGKTRLPDGAFAEFSGVSWIGRYILDGMAVVVVSESPDMWSRETYRPTSHDRFTYSIDLSSDGGLSWTLGQIEMS